MFGLVDTNFFMFVCGWRSGLSLVVIFESNYVVLIERAVRYFENYAFGFFGLNSVSCILRNFNGLPFLKHVESVVELLDEQYQ